MRPEDYAKQKQVFFSIGDSVAYRAAVHDPYKDITTSTGPAGGYHGAGGQGATPRIDTALQLSVVWACVRLIAETIATLPLITYERVTEKGREVRKVARAHPLYALLHDSPNADMTAVEFWEAVVLMLCMWGNAYVLISRNVLGAIIAIDLLNPALVTKRRLAGGGFLYLYANPDSAGRREYDEAEVWHIKGFGTDGLCGLSPVGMGWRSMHSAANAETASSRLFGGDMRPGAVLTTKDYLKPDQRAQVKDVIKEGVFGNDRTGALLLIEGATDYKQLSMNPVDAQMLETRQYGVEDLCRWFNVPPSMIGHGTAVSNWGTGREQINLGFLQYVLRPYLVRIEQGIKKSLLAPGERLRVFAEFSIEGLLRSDSAARAEYYSKMVNNGLKTRNECRALENDAPLDGGDELTVQSALIPIRMLGQVKPAQANPAAPAADPTEKPSDADQIDPAGA